MTTLSKIIRPGKVLIPVGVGMVGMPPREWKVDVFCSIEIREVHGRPLLSIQGVVGPRRSGNAWGRSGQIPEILALIPDNCIAARWTRSMINTLDSIWQSIHTQQVCEPDRGTIAFLESLPESEVTPA